MLQAFYNGLSGLFSFSKGLNNVSHNVSNMNTPGFRGSDTFFRSVSGNVQGAGSEIAGTRIRTQAGETRQTGNDTDLAIDGEGLFVLRDNQGNLFYTRAGQFQVNADGILIDTITKYRVAGIDGAGNLIDLSIAGQRTLPAKATTTIEMTGNLVVGSTTHTVSSVQVFDATGAAQTLSIAFAKQTSPNSTWKVDISNAAGTVIGTGNIAFAPDGSPLIDANKVTFTLTSNGQNQSIVLDFGTPGNFNFATQFSGSSSTLGARVKDGSAIAGLTGFSFDEKGIIKYAYSNGEKRDGAQIGLAIFADETALVASEKSLYRAPEIIKPEFGRATSGKFGRIQGRSIELSNIDLSQEFGDILIIQRGYQASSRIMTVSNEMLEQLYNNTRGG